MSKYSIHELAAERILVLDGGLGTMVQTYGLGEQDYRGERFASWHTPLKGCNDILVLTRPEVLQEIHTSYLTAGADIISTDSFNANAVSMADYGLQEYVYEINRAAAAVARRPPTHSRCAIRASRVLWQAPWARQTGQSSMSSDVNDPASRDVTFDDLKSAYTVQAEGLLDGGADHTADRNRLRHSQRKSRPDGNRRSMRKAGGKNPRNGIRNAGRRKRTHAVGPDRSKPSTAPWPTPTCSQ